MAESNIEKRLNELKSSFTKISDIKNEDITIFSILEVKMIKLKENYAELINNNKHTLFIFGLDSFRFQSKLIDIEYNDMKRLFLSITNRMYCEYFKLFKIVLDYVREITVDKKLLDFISTNDNFPIYKDLEPFKHYDFEIIQNIHESLITLLTSLNDILMNKEHDTKLYQNKNDIGFNIDNFVNTLNFNNIMMREKIILFISYMEFFHKLHRKFLKRFTTKLQLMNSQISHDIKFEDNEASNKTKNKDMLESLVDDEIENGIMKALKESINDNITESDLQSSASKSLDKGYDDAFVAIECRDDDGLNNVKIEINDIVADVVEQIVNENVSVLRVDDEDKKEDIIATPDEVENLEESLKPTEILTTLINDDDISIVSMESMNESNISVVSTEKTEEPVPVQEKKKRVYKPRKKKNDNN